MFAVFDCTMTEGRTCVVPFRWMAHAIACVVSAVTGRFHDFDSI
jgi:hypothetical protein